MPKLYVIATDRSDFHADELDEGETVTLFWNDQNGFGSLSDATIYTEAEAQNASLPFADNQPEWVELPDFSQKALVLPLTAPDNAVLEQAGEIPDIEWKGSSGDWLWIGLNGISVKLKHDDNGVVVDIYGDLDAETVSSTWAEFPSDSDKPEITANAYSDDRLYEVSFNAAPWFANATYDEILALARCGWGGDYPADAVVHSTIDNGDSNHVADLSAMMEYVTKKKDLGFECHIDEGEAMAWLKAHRKDLADHIAREAAMES